MPESPLPLWCFSSWWSEFLKGTPQYNHRLADYINIRKHGIPIVMVDDALAVISVELASPLDCEKEVDFGHPQAPNPQIVCRYCGQRKDEFLRFLAEIKKAKEEKQTCTYSTRTGGIVRTIDPHFTCGFVDYPGDHGNLRRWVWCKCVHIKAWKPENDIPKRTKKFGGDL